MVRAAANDMMQSFRFHVTAALAGGGDPLQPTDQRDGSSFEDKQAGFQSATLPDITLESVEYREGIWKWTQKYPGPPTVSDVSLTRGATKKDTSFHTWTMDAIDGKEYRADVTIYQFQRDQFSRAAPDGETVETTDMRRWECANCFGMRAKAGGDFDSMSGEVSLQECDFTVESFDVFFE